MKIKNAISDKEKKELDELLWNVLWKPLGFPRDIRESFKLDTPQVDLVAIDNGVVVGGLVANWVSENEIEIRHICVKFDYQRLSIGKNLVESLIKLVHRDTQIKIITCARNTSTNFFAKLGFKSIGGYIYHQDFISHGIKFQKMYLLID